MFLAMDVVIERVADRKCDGHPVGSGHRDPQIWLMLCRTPLNSFNSESGVAVRSGIAAEMPLLVINWANMSACAWREVQKPDLLVPPSGWTLRRPFVWLRGRSSPGVLRKITLPPYYRHSCVEPLCGRYWGHRSVRGGRGVGCCANSACVLGGKHTR